MRFLNRAQESFTTTGTGTLTLGGAPTGWRTFAAALNADHGLSGTVAVVAYFAVSADEATWEFGYGTVDTAAGTITRNPISSSTGSAINWPAGTKYIFSTPEAIHFTKLFETHRGSSAPATARAGTPWLDTAAGVTDVRFKIYDGADWNALFSIDETNNRVYPLDLTGAKIGGAQVDLASATTPALGGTASDRVRITGTTTITGFGTVADGVRRKVRFAAALVLTHNAPPLILPGGQNITTAADDEAEFVSLGSGNWKCVYFQRADGQLVAGVISPAQLTANTDDYNPTGFNLATVLRVSTDASRNLTGLTAPSPARPKRVLLLNVGANALVLKHDQTSTAANRFYTPNNADYTIAQNSGALLEYDPTSSRWRVVDVPAPASDGSVILSAQSVSGVASVDFDNLFNDTLYGRYELEGIGVKHATDDTTGGLRIGTGAGPTYQTSGYHSGGRFSNNAAGGDTTFPTDRILLTRGGGGSADLGNAAGENLAFTASFSNPSASDFCHVRHKTRYIQASGAGCSVDGGGHYNAAGAITGIRYLASSGNVSGLFILRAWPRA